MAYENLELIVRYDGTKGAFESSTHKTSYINAKTSKVVFISGDADGNGQAIWVTNGTSHKYLDMTNIDNIKSGLKHIAGLAINDAVQTFEGGAGLNFKTASGSSLKINLNPSNTVDKNGVPYWYIEFDDSDLKSAIIGSSSDASTADTIYGAKAYTDALKGTSGDGANTVTVHGVKNYALAAANTAKSEAKSDVIGNASTDTKDSKTIEGTRKYVDEKVKEINEASGGVTNRVIALEEAMPKKADLDANNHILLEQLPDVVLGQVMFGGTITSGGTNAMQVTVSAQFKAKYGVTSDTLTVSASDASKYEGSYFIVSGAANVMNLSTAAGDWVISDGSTWRKIDNTDAVSSVAGETGVITATALAKKLSETGDSNELALKSEVDAKYTKPADGIPHSDLTVGVKAQLGLASSSIQGVSIDSGSANYAEATTDSSNKTTVKVKTTTMEVAIQNDLLGSTGNGGLASAEDVYEFIKSRLSVKVLS
jgi:hypothetical protein